MRWTRRCRVRMRSQGEEIRERSREARKTSGVVADGEGVWSWHPLLVSSRAEAHSAQPGYEMPCNPCGDGGKRNSSPGRARYRLLKPLRGECRMFSGASAVNTRAHTLLPQRARGCGCIGHPAFPAPSSFEGHDDGITSRRSAPAGRWRLSFWWASCFSQTACLLCEAKLEILFYLSRILGVYALLTPLI